LPAAAIRRAEAASILINNGLAPPNPDNVIDDGTYASDTVYVRNAGCPPAGDPFSAPCPSPGGPTGVSVIPGISLITTLQLRVYETSTATIDGGRVPGGLYALDSADVTINDGYVGGNGIRASGSASVTVLGGRVWSGSPSTSMAEGMSVITVSGGSVRALKARDSSSAIVAGGAIDYLIGEDSSSVVLDAGSTSTLTIRDSSSIVMSGGEVSDLLRVDGSGGADISGGTIQWLYLTSLSPASITGGVISDLEISALGPVSITGGAIDVLAIDNGTATLAGGTAGEMEVLGGDTTLFIKGSGFAVDGIPVPYGDLAALSGTLTGTLASGDWLDSVFTREGLIPDGTITLVPEPATAFLLAAGLAGLAAAARRRRQ
jgi:hypothetical protein